MSMRKSRVLLKIEPSPDGSQVFIYNRTKTVFRQRCMTPEIQARLDMHPNLYLEARRTGSGELQIRWDHPMPEALW